MALLSLFCVVASWRISTLGVSMATSILSRIGPEIRFKYLFTSLSEQLHLFLSGKKPQGHGLSAATSIKSAGYVKLPYVLAICISLSSSGCRRISSAPLRNSGSSSINKTPRCAREITPGLGILPPPASACSEIV